FWKLISDLVDTFSQSDSSHKLFLNAPELYETGFQRLFSCYEEGIDRLYKILKQDVHKTKIQNVKGHRARNVTTYKWQNLQEIDKSKIKKKIKKQVSQPNTVDIKKPYHKCQTTEKEKKNTRTYSF
ncbi:13785_t:CDS:1, partial [Racocetra persica]